MSEVIIMKLWSTSRRRFIGKRFTTMVWGLGWPVDVETKLNRVEL